MKTCTQCHAAKPMVSFARSGAAKDGYHTWCKACKAARSRHWWSLNKERENAKDRTQYAASGERRRSQARAWHCKNLDRSLQNKRDWKLRLYGLTSDDYASMLAGQGHCCAVCRRPTNNHKKQRGFAVDHCHETRLVRGLLCHHCNVGIGHFFDEPELIRAAAAYLERAPKRKTA